MRIDGSFLGWGIFFVLVGAVPLAVQGGYLDPLQVADWWRFWPLLLIGAGLGLILRGTALEGVGGLVAAGTFGVMVGALLSGGLGGFAGVSGGVCGALDAPVAFQTQSGSLAASPTTIDIDLDCGDVTVVTAAGSAWQVEGQDADGVGPEIDSDAATLAIRSNESDGDPFHWLGSRESWRVTIPTDPAVDLDAQINAGSSTFDLANADIGVVALQLNAGTATMDLGETRSVEEIAIELNAGSLGLTLPPSGTSGTIEVNAGSVKLCAPPGVALRLRTNDSIVASYDYDGHGLIHDGSTWESPGFDTAEIRIDLTTEGNAGSFELDPAEGCDG